MSEIIPAATIILLRDEPEFEVLMVERHANIAFAGGAMVFPGGRVDQSDYDPAWETCCEGFSDIPEEQHAARIAALREAFEETGILIASRKGAPIGREEALSLAAWRKRIEADDRLFLELVRSEALTLNIGALHLYARWRPPQGAGHRRYNTWFFATTTPPDQIATADGGEATKVVWTSPAAVLAAREAGRRKMIFPTVRNVELLNVSKSATGVFEFAGARPQRLIEPKLVERDGHAYLTIPDDMGYPVTEESLETAMRF